MIPKVSGSHPPPNMNNEPIESSSKQDDKKGVGLKKKPALKLNINTDQMLTSSGTFISKNKIQANFSDCTLFHGSRSASLLAFTSMGDKAKCELLPTGQLMQQGLVPFSGECGNALAKNAFNKDHLSTVNIQHFNVAYNYSNAMHSNTWNLKDEFDNLVLRPELF